MILAFQHWLLQPDHWYSESKSRIWEIIQTKNRVGLQQYSTFAKQTTVQHASHYMKYITWNTKKITRTSALSSEWICLCCTQTHTHTHTHKALSQEVGMRPLACSRSALLRLFEMAFFGGVHGHSPRPHAGTQPCFSNPLVCLWLTPEPRCVWFICFTPLVFTGLQPLCYS